MLKINYTKYTKLFFFFTIFIVILFFLLKLIDIFLFLNYVSNKNNLNFLLPPLKKVRYYTHEFDSVVSTNKFGFRGDVRIINEKQIIIIGDSQIYGWGLNDDQTFPYLLESILRLNNQNINVYNLGVPGTNTIDHILTAKYYIKRFKPTIAIVGIGISDDFQQVFEQSQQLYKLNILENNEDLYLKNYKKIIKDFYPNIYSLLKNIRNYNLNELFNGYLLATKDWKNISKEQYKKDYPIELIELMKKGFINPGIFQFVSNYPNRNLLFYKNILADNNSPENKILKEIISNFKDLKKIADENNTQLLLLSVPSGAFVKSKNFEIQKIYGFSLSNEDLETFLPEVILKKMSSEIDLNFIETLRLFRQFEEDFFFPYDGHLNVEGSKLVSKIVYNYLNKNFF
jgi:hypothetical protein